MKFKGLILMAGLMVAPGLCFAANPSYEVGYTTTVPRGVIVTTGTVVQLNGTRPTGFTARVAGYRIQNQDAASSIWIGGVSVSTSAAGLATLGEKLGPGADIVFHLGVDVARSGLPLSPIYAMAADGAGADAVLVSVTWFGY